MWLELWFFYVPKALFSASDTWINLTMTCSSVKNPYAYCILSYNNIVIMLKLAYGNDTNLVLVDLERNRQGKKRIIITGRLLKWLQWSKKLFSLMIVFVKLHTLKFNHIGMNIWSYAQDMNLFTITEWETF